MTTQRPIAEKYLWNTINKEILEISDSFDEASWRLKDFSEMTWAKEINAKEEIISLMAEAKNLAEKIKNLKYEV